MDTVKFEGTKRRALLASVSTVAAFAALSYGAQRRGGGELRKLGR